MSLEQLNVLLADDDKDDCIFFKTALEQFPESTQLAIVHDGEELMNYLAENIEHLPDIIFLDINMPRKTGLECISEIKQNEKLKDLPVVMLSTMYVPETIRTLFNKGVQVYIRKPGDFAQLKQVIHHALPIASEKTFSNSRLKYILNA